jgi:hypothetical protein
MFYLLLLFIALFDRNSSLIFCARAKSEAAVLLENTKFYAQGFLEMIATTRAAADIQAWCQLAACGLHN